jgi:hypothetical protein
MIEFTSILPHEGFQNFLSFGHIFYINCDIQYIKVPPNTKLIVCNKFTRYEEQEIDCSDKIINIIIDDNEDNDYIIYNNNKIICTLI